MRDGDVLGWVCCALRFCASFNELLLPCVCTFSSIGGRGKSEVGGTICDIAELSFGEAIVAALITKVESIKAIDIDTFSLSLMVLFKGIKLSHGAHLSMQAYCYSSLMSIRILRLLCSIGNENGRNMLLVTPHIRVNLIIYDHELLISLNLQCIRPHFMLRFTHSICEFQAISMFLKTLARFVVAAAHGLEASGGRAA